MNCDHGSTQNCVKKGLETLNPKHFFPPRFPHYLLNSYTRGVKRPKRVTSETPHKPIKMFAQTTVQQTAFVGKAITMKSQQKVRSIVIRVVVDVGLERERECFFSRKAR